MSIKILTITFYLTVMVLAIYGLFTSSSDYWRDNVGLFALLMAANARLKQELDR